MTDEAPAGRVAPSARPQHVDAEERRLNRRKAAPVTPSDAVDHDARERLRAAGLRGTLTRIAVYRALAERRAPVTHAEVVTTLGPASHDRATVYRALVDLAEAGLVRRGDHGDRVFRFELASSRHGFRPGHAHFTCTACGVVRCLDDVRLELPAVEAGPGLRADEIQVRGRCERCP